MEISPEVIESLGMLLPELQFKKQVCAGWQAIVTHAGVL